MSSRPTPYCYKYLLEPIKDSWDRHDPNCESLLWFWFGREDGPMLPFGEVGACAGCHAYFYSEGLVDIGPSDDDPVFVCQCCAETASKE